MKRKTAIVTGGPRGIGFGIMSQLAADGFNLVILGTKPEGDVAENLDKLRASGAEVLYLQGTIAKAEDCARCVEQAVARFGKIDVLVNNAGIAPRVRADILETSAESIDEVFAVNVKGTFFMSQAVARQMLVQEDGIIVNISSMSAYTSSVNRPDYCMSKASIAMMTKLFADRMAAHGVRVFEVRPGIIKTDMTAGVTGKYDKLLADGNFPIERWGYPEDVAKAVCAFASGAFPYSTGDVINVDGGFHLRRL